MTIVLADADMILFQAVSSSQLELEWQPDVWVWQADLGLARERFWDHVAEAGDLVGGGVDDVVLAFTSRSGFRREIYPEYKSGRKDRKPPGYGALKADLLNDRHAVMHDSIEADDVISMLARQLGPKQCVVYSGDKDLDQVPGVHVFRGKDPYTVTEEEATRNTWIQALTGDATDGIPGCPGVGPVKAKKLLADVDMKDERACWDVVIEAYARAEKSYEFAITMTQLTRMLRPDEYDFTHKAIKLWTPSA